MSRIYVASVALALFAVLTCGRISQAQSVDPLVASLDGAQFVLHDGAYWTRCYLILGSQVTYSDCVYHRRPYCMQGDSYSISGKTFDGGQGHITPNGIVMTWSRGAKVFTRGSGDECNS